MTGKIWSWWPHIVCTLAIVLLILSYVAYVYHSKVEVGDIIATDVVRLQKIFTQINTVCGIIGFEKDVNAINFLNVGSFSGSKVGPLQLKNPTRWQGPYLEKNPTIQGREYDVVKTKKGYFIVPGSGVQLPNGKIMGKQITISATTNVARFTQPGAALWFADRSLAVPVIGTEQGEKVTMDDYIASDEDEM